MKDLHARRRKRWINRSEGKDGGRMGKLSKGKDWEPNFGQEKKSPVILGLNLSNEDIYLGVGVITTILGAINPQSTEWDLSIFSQACACLEVSHPGSQPHQGTRM